MNGLDAGSYGFRPFLEKDEYTPFVVVGLMSNVDAVSFELKGEYFATVDERYSPGSYRATAAGDHIDVNGRALPWLRLGPLSESCSFVICDVVIGIDFHWERKQDQEFSGMLLLKLDERGRLTVIIEDTAESYLTNVISSEMSASAHPELLKAHAVVSRSWLLAQLHPWNKARKKPSFKARESDGEKQLIRWYDQESHSGFNVCADDHCQRYQGFTKASLRKAKDAIRETRGQVLAYGEELCDARYSKSCGGMTERFNSAWEDVDAPYLPVQYDGESFPPGYALPLRDEANAAAWIRNAPPAFCNTNDRSLLGKILPDFDQETTDFYRWRVTIEQEELQELLWRKLGVKFGKIRRLEPVERGGSGRIVRLRIVGEHETMTIGKELEIRRALSPSHLYSSAFVVETDEDASRFTLIGAGWGHGVGLCQIGAALMAERGYSFQQILQHYYRGARLFELYE
jgi:SpoIID/LytB domain protein